MTFSRPLLGTNTSKTKLSWIEYYWNSCILQGWYNTALSFRNWADLMGGNTKGYGILPEDDDVEFCISYFWDSLEDDIYPKEFLEHLLKLSEEVNLEKVKTYTINELFEDLNNDDE